MLNQYANPYYNPYQPTLSTLNQTLNQPISTLNQTLPQQQIPTANGRASVDNIKLAPNSSVLIADSTMPIIYRCVSDSLGNVTVLSFDISPHKEDEQIKKEQNDIILADLVRRIERLENESNTKWSKSNEKYESDKADDESVKERKQSAGSNKSTNAKQS